MSYKGKLNQYVCKSCDRVITTVDTDDGTTSMTIPCVTKGCNGHMHSQFYMVEQSLIPEYEWYAPPLKAMKNNKRKYRDHVRMGGLLLRPLADHR